MTKGRRIVWPRWASDNKKADQRRVDGWIQEWAEDRVNGLHKSDLYGINVIEKILRDPGIATGGSRDRVLYWPRNPRIAKISRAVHQIDPRAVICLLVKFGRPLNNDGTVFTLKDLSSHSTLKMREINTLISEAKNKLRVITMG